MRKKDHTGKNHSFFYLKTLKNFILNEKFYPQMITIYSLNQGTFFHFSEKGRGQLPLPLPSSYTPDMRVTITDIMVDNVENKVESLILGVLFEMQVPLEASYFTRSKVFIYLFTYLFMYLLLLHLQLTIINNALQ